MSSISDALTALNNSLNSLVPTLTNKVNRKVAEAALADNALALNGQSASQMIATAAAHTDTHANNKNNPHGVTAAQIGAYSTSQVDAMVASLIPSGILPVSTFGTIDGAAIPMTVSGSTGAVNFSAGIPVIIAGQYFSLPAINFAVAKPSNNNKIYLQLQGGVPKIISSPSTIPESSTNMYLGSISIDASGNVTNTVSHVVRIDTYRLSTTSAGSAIPVSTGTPDQTGHLAWQ